MRDSTQQTSNLFRSPRRTVEQLFAGTFLARADGKRESHELLKRVIGEHVLAPERSDPLLGLLGQLDFHPAGPMMAQVLQLFFYQKFQCVLFFP